MTELNRLRAESKAGSRSHEILLAVLDTIWLRLDDLPVDTEAAKARVLVALAAHVERNCGADSG